MIHLSWEAVLEARSSWMSGWSLCLGLETFGTSLCQKTFEIVRTVVLSLSTDEPQSKNTVKEVF